VVASGAAGLAYETDLLEYPDLFDGSHVIEERTTALMAEAWEELSDVLALGGRSRPSTS